MEAGHPWVKASGDSGGIQIIDLAKGACAEWFRIDGAVKELFDVAVLKGHACPMSIGPNAPEIVKFMTH